MNTCSGKTSSNIMCQLKLYLQQDDDEVVVVKADRNLYFPSVDRFREDLRKASESRGETQRSILLDFSSVNQVDHTSLKVRFRIGCKKQHVSWNHLFCIIDAALYDRIGRESGREI